MAKLSAFEIKEIIRRIKRLERDLKYAFDDERLEIEDEILRLKVKIEDPYNTEENISEPRKKYKAIYKKGFERRK